nr:Chain A, Alpha-crystallin B chain peptide [Homo sapiens]7ROJ_B Chain B, Alpha-crystallin B chain peptide [Homo sapiens]7ROJ_C Chain C, Alpha-crystallin B chain peptide [Homo sapiens]7ROJ_D Chain D, Alpha-crystallin B chain peptide [Homo sapiens]7ROJ_E Chain E, Alpha-crystallin B chain peptide [Homo sapiens]7ROJ_F Chain F, Alpha-crystallin B chain peptide [Homo sapiens]7ROJ_G Chain G, Alpha-crystallin B chain peptide [Homo sapiens]7ROJ_H Chain H, Alpha-crystallin B chain peptide [Homo sapi
KVKVLWDVIEV